MEEWPILTSSGDAVSIGRGGFGALRRFIAFFVSSRTVLALGLRPQIGDVRKAPDLELRMPRRSRTAL